MTIPTVPPDAARVEALERELAERTKERDEAKRDAAGYGHDASMAELDWNRLLTGDRRALNPAHQDVFDSVYARQDSAERDLAAARRVVEAARTLIAVLDTTPVYGTSDIPAADFDALVKERDALKRVLASLPGSPSVVDLADAATFQMRRADMAEAREREAVERRPEHECPECRGEGRVLDGFVSSHDVYGDAEIETRVVPCGLCGATGRITRAAMSVYKARGGMPPVKARRF